MKEVVVTLVGTVVGYFAVIKAIGYINAKKEKDDE